jgi:hypothetical protein
MARRWVPFSFLLFFNLAACEPQVAEMTMTAPGLDGPLTQGRWEQRQRDGLTFWPPNPNASRLPEMIDFSCTRSGARLRLTITGDLDKTGLWIAADERSSRKVLFETEDGVSELQLTAGDKRLPSVEIPLDEDMLSPLLTPGGRFAINAFGSRTYRLEAVPEIADTLSYCVRRR